MTPISRLSEAALACSPITKYNESVDRFKIGCVLQGNQPATPSLLPSPNPASAATAVVVVPKTFGSLIAAIFDEEDPDPELKVP